MGKPPVMSSYLIDNGSLLDATGRSPVARTSVYIDGNLIAKIGPAAELRAFAQARGPYELIDATGHTIMPGLIDCHVHPSYGDITSIEELDIYTSREYRTLRGALACKKVLRAGVTAMCCPGGNWNIN